MSSLEKFEGMTLQALRDQRLECERQIAGHESAMRAIDTQIRPLHDARSRETNAVAILKREIAEIDRKIALKSAPRLEPTVTDHALLRYIERVHGIDLDVLREHILTDTVRDGILGGASAVKLEGMTLKIANNSVVTIMTDSISKPKPHRLTRAQRERMEEDDCQHALSDEEHKFMPIPGGWI